MFNSVQFSLFVFLPRYSAAKPSKIRDDNYYVLLSLAACHEMTQHDFPRTVQSLYQQLFLKTVIATTHMFESLGTKIRCSAVLNGLLNTRLQAAAAVP